MNAEDGRANCGSFETTFNGGSEPVLPSGFEAVEPMGRPSMVPLQLSFGLYYRRSCPRSKGESQDLDARRLRQSKTLLIVVFALLLLAEMDLVVWQQRGQIFAGRAKRTGSALLDFAEERSQLLERKAGEPFEPYEQRIAVVNRETESLYAKEYAPEVRRLHDGFSRRGLKTPELDEFYRRPGSTVALQEVGAALFNMGAALSSERLSTTSKNWLRRFLHF